MNQVAEDILMHYGMPRRSGRYPWGSGDNPIDESFVYPIFSAISFKEYPFSRSPLAVATSKALRSFFAKDF